MSFNISKELRELLESSSEIDEIMYRYYCELNKAYIAKLEDELFNIVEGDDDENS